MHGQQSLPSVPDWCNFMQMRMPNHQSLIGPKGTVLIDQKGATLIGQGIWWGYN